MMVSCADDGRSGSGTNDAATPDAATMDAATVDTAVMDTATFDTSRPDVVSDAPPVDAAIDVQDGGIGDTLLSDGGLTAANCFRSQFVNPAPADFGPDYDQYSPVMGSHCMGTNHQDIQNVQRVVFVGDSVTVGTPPTMTTDYYRVKLANRLASQFGLNRSEGLAGGFLFEGWSTVDVLNGTSINRNAGDFAHCGKWGARTDDLMRDNDQVIDCIPESERNKTTLVIMTIGGNDIFNLTEDASEDATEEALRESAEGFVQLLEDTVRWLKEPGRFPNGVYVVFANMYEYTDATRDLNSCPGAALAGFDGMGRDILEELIIWANEQYLRIAVETGTDMIFMLEAFCGHGFARDDADGICYRGAGSAAYFDDTCIHPTPAGHQAIADMFLATVNE